MLTSAVSVDVVSLNAARKPSTMKIRKMLRGREQKKFSKMLLGGAGRAGGYPQHSTVVSSSSPAQGQQVKVSCYRYRAKTMKVNSRPTKYAEAHPYPDVASPF
mmetsp:Transcript_9603/g.32168  ORF Transcript_9603/g.32168 Transcript_9603/m.32168 type:complete len:103 (-) Transcript_9603:977-1285(-)